jgi:hypothetical protein
MKFLMEKSLAWTNLIVVVIVSISKLIFHSKKIFILSCKVFGKKLKIGGINESGVDTKHNLEATISSISLLFKLR